MQAHKQHLQTELQQSNTKCQAPLEVSFILVLQTHALKMKKRRSAGCPSDTPVLSRVGGGGGGLLELVHMPLDRSKSSRAEWQLLESASAVPFAGRSRTT